jgi:dUTP pyrophosphatase
MTTLKFYKTDPKVLLPKFQTEQSACFDLSYQPYGKSMISGVNRMNAPFTRDINLVTGTVKIAPGERAMIPTGMILDIPEGYSVRIHPRSGLAYKSGIVLANCEGVIDSDYVQELFILVHNSADVAFLLTPDDRIAQAELIKVESYTLEETTTLPTQKTDRVGGMGSTGVNTLPDDYVGVAPMTAPSPELWKLRAESEKKGRVSKPIEKIVTEDGRTVYQVEIPDDKTAEAEKFIKEEMKKVKKSQPKKKIDKPVEA